MIRRGALKGELIGYPAIDFSPDGRLVAFISGGGVKLQGQMESWEISGRNVLSHQTRNFLFRFLRTGLDCGIPRRDCVMTVFRMKLGSYPMVSGLWVYRISEENQEVVRIQ
jgi:hypothetical protein